MKDYEVIKMKRVVNDILNKLIRFDSLDENNTHYYSLHDDINGVEGDTVIYIDESRKFVVINDEIIHKIYGVKYNKLVHFVFLNYLKEFNGYMFFHWKGAEIKF